MRIIGAMRISDAFAEYCQLSINLMSQFCDGVCFVTNNVTRSEVREAIDTCQNSLGTKETTSPWSHHLSFHDAYEFAISHGADWVVLSDHDEILPYEQLMRQIDIAEKEMKMVIAFPFLNCWETPTTIVDPSVNQTGDHGKIFKAGIPNFQESSCCVPEGYWNSIHACRYPLRHCHMMTEVLRARRLKERGWIEPWATTEPKTIPFKAEWTIEEYYEFLRKN